MDMPKLIVLPHSGNAHSYGELLGKLAQLEDAIGELHRYLYKDLKAIEKRLDDGGL